jgi:hypothetical protein
MIKKQTNALILKQQFLDRAKALSKLPEVFRCRQVTQLICDTIVAPSAGACPFRKLYPDVLMMEPGQDRNGYNGARPLDGST